MDTRKSSIAGAVIVVVIVAAYFALGRRVEAPTLPQSIATSTAIATSTQGTGIEGAGSYTIQNLQSRAIFPPDFNNPILYASNISAADRSAINATLAKDQAILAKNAQDFKAWINLGTLHKEGGDYQGAAEIWEYVSAAWPTNTVSFNNLGDLYQNFLKDYPKAEAAYLKAIANKSDYADSYRNLFSMYTTVYKQGTSAAEDILKRGIAANPKAIDLQVLLARYYRDLGRTADAKSEYDAAIQNAKAQGQTDLASQIQEEAGQP